MTQYSKDPATALKLLEERFKELQYKTKKLMEETQAKKKEKEDLEKSLVEQGVDINDLDKSEQEMNTKLIEALIMLDEQMTLCEQKLNPKKDEFDFA